MKLRTKIHLFTTLLMLLLLVVTNIGIYFFFEKLAYNTEYDQLKRHADELVETLNQLDEKEDPKPVLRTYMPLNGLVRVIGEDGKVKTSVEASLALKEVKVSRTNKSRYEVGEMNDSTFIILTVPAIWIDGSIVKIDMIQLLDDVERNMELLELILFAVTVVATIPILLSSIVLSRLILKPLEHLSEIMKKSASSGTYEKIGEAIDRKDELGEIGRTFNGMMDALETNYKKQEQFVSNASHELKTPLTVIESYAKLLVRRGFSNEQVAKEALEAIVSESSRMNEMMIQMLELAKNKERLFVRIESINLTALLKNTLNQMEHAYNRTFIFKGEREALITTDEKMLKQLLFIILDNARKYSDKQIVVQLEKEQEAFKVSIRDFGRGIPPEQLPYVFDRFYRVSEDRNRKTGGTGLGLSIAKELSEKLRIHIQVESTLGEGSCFSLVIPEALENR